MAPPVEWTDPCQRAQALGNAYYNMLAGAAEQEIRTRTIDAEEVVRFYQTDLGTLLAELTSAQRECARKTGTPDPNRRFFIAAGSRRRGPWTGDRGDGNW